MTAPQTSSSLPSLLLLVFLVAGLWTMLAGVAEAATNVHIVYMGEKQNQDSDLTKDSHHHMLATLLGSRGAANVSMLYSYRHGFSGFAARLTVSQAEEIARAPGVLRVIPNRVYKLHTTRSWDYLGQHIDSPSSLLVKGKEGEGVIAGVFDTGIWPESESFNDEGLEAIPSRWKGICQSGQLFNFTNCNNKLIGARWYIKGFLAELGEPYNKTRDFDYLSPRDVLGHGTHVSSILAGSILKDVSYKGLGNGLARGGAPRARLAVYKVCWNLGGRGQCTSADVLKAFDDAIHDGVDLLSLSLGGRVPFFSEVDEENSVAIGAFHAVARGIPVVCSGGNDGPSANTIGNASPWILTVGASNMDRAFPTIIHLGNNRTITGQAMFTGNKSIDFAGLVFPEAATGLDPSASTCERLDITGISVKGKVVLCFTTILTRSAALAASSVVKAAGGVGVIVAKNPSGSVSPCNDFPCIQVDYQAGTQILYYIRSSGSPVVKVIQSKTLVGRPVSSKVAYFSSRGPSSVSPAILKPDIAAPGVNILAATSPSGSVQDKGFIFQSGTSMACPVVSGIVVLLKSIHPQWSPAAIKSALVTTASTNDEDGEPIFAEGINRKLADAFDYGGGIVNPNRASNPGLIFDMGTLDYIHYLCSMGYNDTSISAVTSISTRCSSNTPSILDLNLPSITIPNLGKAPLTVFRTVTNVGPVNSVYAASIEPPVGVYVSVKPNVMVFNSSTKVQSFEVSFRSTHVAQGVYYFGNLRWADGEHVVRIPISVRPEIIPSYVDNS